MKPDNELEEFTKFILKETKQESPSIEFVANVMKSVKEENIYAIRKADKPLISKKGWFLITVIIVGLCVLAFLENSTNTSLFSVINVTFLNKLKIVNPFENIKFSNIFTLSFVFFALMVLLQVAVIKSYFNKHDSI